MRYNRWNNANTPNYEKRRFLAACILLAPVLVGCLAIRLHQGGSQADLDAGVVTTAAR